MTTSIFTGAPGSVDVLPSPLATTVPAGDSANPPHHELHTETNDSIAATQEVVIGVVSKIAAGAIGGTASVGQVLTAATVSGGAVTSAEWETPTGGGGGGSTTGLSFAVSGGVPTFTSTALGTAVLSIASGIPTFTE